MTNTTANNKRIAKNTIFLYIRMLLIMGVTLYTSRVVLEVLGVTDFGIYNVVGGLASSFVFFSTSLSNATQRFLNIELGKNNLIQVRNIFNLSLLVYVVIALGVVLISEPIGSWFIEYKLSIPSDRMEAVYWVFHIMILSLVITLVGTVFDSILIARENMKIYSYVGIFEAVGKLLIVYLLAYLPFDKLKLYSLLLFSITFIAKAAPAVYCIRHYQECQFRYFWDKSLFLSLFKFVGWNTVGTAVWAINEQGMNLLLNMFFGPIVNAARAVSVQVNAAVNNFTSNFFVAVRPQIVKSYANRDYDYFIQLLYSSSRYSFYLMWLLSLPIILRTSYILCIWLGTVPEYTVSFVQWILIYSLVNVLTNPFWSAIQAIGKLKQYIIIGSLVYLMAFPISYIFLKLGYNPVVSFQILSVVRFVYLFVTMKIVKNYIEFSIWEYVKKVFFPIILIIVPSWILNHSINSLFPETFLSLVYISLISLILTITIIYYIGISSKERLFINAKIMDLYVRKNNKGI